MFMSKDFKDNIPGRFTEVARSFADRPALSLGGSDLSYGDLDARSDALARGLVGLGVLPGARVAVPARRGPETIVAFLAILKAGAGYVPLPESYPTDRLEHIRSEAEIDFVVGDFPALEALGVRKIDPDTLDRADHAEVGALPTPGAESLAYVMYTSGSTGLPKGVMVPHRGIVRLVQGQDFMDLGPDERILQNAPLAFDAATLEIWGALLNGGTLVLPEGEETGTLRGLGAVIKRERITTMWLTAGLFHVMADERPGDFAPLRQLLTGGDVVSPVKVRRVMEACPDLTVINGYGPTENTTFTCCHTITGEDLASGRALPIGRAIAGTQVYVTDPTGQPVPDGETGELCAAGFGLALGYLGRPDLTEAAFVPAAWDAETRLYRTGDLVRRDADGVVQYLGRLDTQVKIRGFRVELGEIETGLEAHPGVGQAAVVAVAVAGADGADKTLVGYYTGTAEAADLSAHLADRVPDYAMPQRLARVDALPVNQNGKVDRKDLEARGLPAIPRNTQHQDAAPQGPVEERLAAIWAGVLGIEQVDAITSFFELGGHSLLAVRLFDRIRTEFGSDLPISTLFRHQTIRDLAGLLSEVGSSPDAPDASDGAVATALEQTEFGLVDRTADWDTSVVIHPGPDTGGALPFFVVGGVGGNVNNLFDLGQEVGRTRPVVGLQTRGVLGHTPRGTIEEMAAENIRYVRQHQPQGPYVIAGYSGGALTAFEMTRQLEAAGETVQHLLVLDTYAPGFAKDFIPNIRISKGERILDELQRLQNEGLGHFLSRMGQWAQFKLYQGPFKKLLRARSLSQYRYRAMQEMWSAAARVYDPDAVLKAPIALFYTPPQRLRDRIALSEDQTLGWSNVTRAGPVEVTMVAGDHNSMLVGANAESLARQLDAIIGAARPGQ